MRLPTHGRVYSRGSVCVCVCNVEELTNIQQRPGGETESMESKGEKGGESCGKLNWALNTSGDHSHLHRTSHTQLDFSAGTCKSRENTLM